MIANAWQAVSTVKQTQTETHATRELGVYSDLPTPLGPVRVAAGAYWETTEQSTRAEGRRDYYHQYFNSPGGSDYVIGHETWEWTTIDQRDSRRRARACRREFQPVSSPAPAADSG